MVLRDGNKYACDSCIRGHRVSGCNHTDRELHFIARKGRPVKQCEHCRGARKSKSHHAKCDCGGKKDRNEVKLDDKECCCNLGDSCTCGSREPGGLRLDTSFSKPLHTRPHPPKLGSEGHLTTFINSKHKACHKWDIAQSHGPYPRPKLSAASCHSSSPSLTGAFTLNSEMTLKAPDSVNGHRDDSHIVPVPATGNFISPSMDNLPLSYLSNNLFTASAVDGMQQQQQQQQQQQLSATTPTEEHGLCPVPPDESLPASYLDELMSANTIPSPTTKFLPVQGAPSIYRSTQDDFFDIENASFGSNDLPLNSGPLTPDFPQPTSFTDESNGYSAPGLTANSSAAPSELDDTMTFPERSPESIFDPNVFPLGFDFQDLTSLDPNATTPSQPMPPPPTSDPLPQAARRPLDAQAQKRSSAFTTFDRGLPSYITVPDYDGAALTGNSSMLDQLSSSAPPNDAKPSLLRSTSFDLPSTASTTMPERPRSVTVSTNHHCNNYNPSTVIDQMYPQLNQDFANAANWDPSVLSWNMSSFMPPMR